MLRKLIRETVLGYVFWSLFQALAPMIWFYPLNELEISGYEGFAVFLLSPILLGFGKVREFLQTDGFGLVTLRCLSVASLASFQAPSTLTRLIILSVGCFCIMLIFAVSIYADQENRTITLWGHILGLYAFIVSRIWFVTFVPVWWTPFTNSTVIAIAAIATIDRIICDYQESNKKVIKNSTKKPEETAGVQPIWLLTGIGFGSLLFLIHWVFGEVSLVTRWSIQEYPNTGPLPYPWSLTVLFGLWFGIELSPCTHVTQSITWWMIGTLSFCALYYLKSWPSFIGGVILSMYTMSVLPGLADRVVACPPARTVCLALLTWLMEILFSVWTVAYNFVPGGEYTREHTDWLMGFTMLSIGAATLTRRQECGRSTTAFASVNGVKMPCKKTKTILVLLLLFGIGGFLARFPQQKISHQDKVHPKADFTAAIWTFHFGYDNKGWPSMERAAIMLNETGADVITLLESDASKPYLGNNDLGQWLGEKLSMYVDFGPSTKDHTWGNLILSKYPFVKSKHHLLPSPRGELAPAITATVNMSGLLVDFVVTHMGNDKDVLDRKLQAEYLANELNKAENPVVFLGYVTSEPGSREYKKLIEVGNVKDIDSTDSQRWCEYIMYRGLIRLGYARISHGGLSDTEIQMARFRIPDDPYNYIDHDRIVTMPNKLNPDEKFNDRFGKFRVGHNWEEVHRYHMSTPKYFLPQ